MGGGEPLRGARWRRDRITSGLYDAGVERERVGRLFTVSRGDLTFEVLPLPHPSGRSTWINRPANAKLLDRALALLARTRGWRQTFGRRTRFSGGSGGS